MLDEVKKNAAGRMQKSIDLLKQEYARLRTGRANAGLLDHVRVEYYGTEVPLSQTSNIVVEDARTISITPWDKSMVATVEKAILASDLGLTPTTAGTVIRIVLPALTEERRRELAKVVKQEAEQARIAIRNVRRDANQELKERARKDGIPEDAEKRIQEEIQKLTDQHIAKVDELMAAKEKEVLSI